MEQEFSLKKYLGTWYELVHYPSWFQLNDSYNTTAKYTIQSDGKVKVHNSTIVQGEKIDSYGTATYLGGNKFQVDFSLEEIQRLIATGQYQAPTSPPGMVRPNYVVEAIWKNRDGDYIYAVVTDANRDSLYLLSRFPHPSLSSYNRIMKYIAANFNRQRLVQTPHYAN